MDVRPKHIYEKAHPEGAKNAPLFRKFDVMNKPSFTGILRATALALNGVEAVEPNPEFGATSRCCMHACTLPDVADACSPELVCALLNDFRSVTAGGGSRGQQEGDCGV